MAATSTLARAALALTALFGALTAAAQSGSYDGAAVLAFVLPPPDCAVPCWQYIRPGEPLPPPSQLAIQIDCQEELIIVASSMDQHGFFKLGYWSSRGELDNDCVGFGRTWLSVQPSFENKPDLYDVVVSSFTVRSVIAFGDLWLALGPPAWVVQRRGDHAMSVEAVFPDLHLIGQVDVRCDGRPSAIWRAPVTLRWYAEQPPEAVPEALTRPLGQCGGA